MSKKKENFLLTDIATFLRLGCDPTPDEKRWPLHQLNYWTLVDFLQENDLTTHVLSESIDGITNEFELRRNDLKRLGLEFYFAAEKNALNLGYKGDKKAFAKAGDKKRFQRILNKINSDAAKSQQSNTQKTPIFNIPNRPLSTVKPKKQDVKYDDASWHVEGEFPDDLPDEAANTHIGMFLTWALLAGFAGEEFIEDFGEELEQLSKSKMTPGEFLMILDGVFMDEQLSDEGNAFTQDYYEGDKSQYTDDYTKYLCSSLPTLYHAEDSWKNFEILKPILEERLVEWEAKTK